MEMHFATFRLQGGFMKKLMMFSVLLWTLAATPAMWALDQTADTAAADHSAPSYDMKAQSLLDLERVQKKFVDLANAVPAGKFTWRPTDDSRSFAEVLLHVAGER